MAEDTQYGAIPYIYKSRGLVARPILDQAPEYVYLQLMNCLEREEEGMSSRYGTQIINRDPAGIGTSNYYFSFPVNSLARLNYQASAWRYAGLDNGTLWRRAGNSQGAYTQIDSGLSGLPFTSLVTNCFETSQPFLFIYDKNISIKDNGTFAAPQLTGIDPSPYTVNVLPYAPLLIMIDSFASTNSYGTIDISGWGFAAIETLDANSGALITDFSQFYGIGPAGGGTTNYTPGTTTTTVTANQTGMGVNTQNSAVISGFPSVVPSFGEVVSVTVEWNGATTMSGPFTTGAFSIQYSLDSGATWGSLAGGSLTTSGSIPAVGSITSSASFSISNLSSLQVRAQAIAVVGAPSSSTVSSTTNILNCYATISNPGAFGPVANGMIALLNTNTTINVPIASITSTLFAIGIYSQLLVTTVAPHGLTPGQLIGIYATTNDLVDGFYQVLNTLSATTFIVNTFPNFTANGTGAQIGATGGYVTGGAAAPFACVLTDQYSSPYPPQVTAWGFYEWVPPTTTAFPISAWSGSVATSTTGTVSKSVTLDLNQNNQVTDDDLIVLTLLTSDPNNIEQIQLQFFVGAGQNNYYAKFIAPAYYQTAVAESQLAYSATQAQILADTLNLITGQPPGTTSAQLQPANISTGSGSWQACYLRRGDFLPVGQAGQAGLDWSNVTGWQLSVTTNANGSSSFSVNGLYLQWGYGPSSFGGVGYDYRQTYYNANTGTESNPTPIQTFNDNYGYLASTTAPIFLRQAAQIIGQYSPDPQVTHVRIYRRGGTLASNWVQVVQVPNVSGINVVTQFVIKDVIADAFVEQAQILVLDNDPPVTSSLSDPIQTTLSGPTGAPGSSIYSTFSPQTVSVVDASAVFVPNQLVVVGGANNLEIAAVVNGGTGQFTAIMRLQHNQGEPVNVYAVPRQPCNLCAFAYNQVWLAGDPNNPHYLYYSKKGLPENFGPQNYIPVSTPDDPINAVINWRGTLIVGTLKSWFIIVGGPTPYAQPTGSVHGIIAQQGWIEVEGAIWYRAADGLREFTGADGRYMTLPIEWIYRLNPLCLPPQADPAQATQDVMAFYNNQVLTSYIALDQDDVHFRNVWDTQYQRWRQDDVNATAMLWEKDINVLLTAKQISPGNYAVVQDQVGDYDDGGWVGPELIQTPINMTIQHPYRDLGKPHYPKQWNGLETDINTQGQDLQTTLLFDDGGLVPPLVLPAQNTGTNRKKVEFIITGEPDTSDEASGQQAYRASILHTMAVTVAPILYQENIYAAVLADYTASYDTYWIKFSIDESKFIKQGYFDYTSPVSIEVNLYADNSQIPYWTFTLPALTVPERAVQRVRFGNVNPGTTAFTCRTWRMIMVSSDPTQPFQLWAKPRIEFKPIQGGSSYQIKELEA